MTKTGWLVGSVLIIVVAGAFLLWSNSASAPTVDEGAASSATGSDTLGQSIDEGGDAMDGRNFEAETSAQMTASVAYNGASYAPATVTIAKGGTVTFTDSAGATMWVASDVHPTHTNFDGTTRSEHCATGYTGAKPFDQCGKGANYSFTFDKPGTYTYHDHANSSAVGTIIVQ